ncbi:MAG: hypothetical protein RL065_1668 [Bacteroidota bacterium]|jgi:predicted AlkP superfamily pyrophosphatase or phosphodiesterase
MKQKIFAFLSFLIISFQVESKPIKQPKLVVGIVIDQMRYDYLYRYWNKYGNGGFKRLLNEGVNCENTHYNYMPTYTGPGHSSIYTGTTPAVHGIVGNNWWSKINNKETYCADDSTVSTIGTSSKAGRMSPRNLLTTTITDELKLSSNFKSKVIGIAIKDRGAILPAGHIADAAYWYDGSKGKWITSSFYKKTLPDWVANFNSKNYPSQFIAKEWNTLLPIEQYTESSADSVGWEGTFKSEKNPVFPHLLSKIVLADTSIKYSLLSSTPYGNTITRLFAEEAISNDNLGSDDISDFITISFSSTDYVGHKYGPNSIEIEDVYLRLDKELELLLQFLDKKIGKKNVFLFLTADHGAAHSPGFSKRYNLPGNIFDGKKMIDSLKSKMNEWFGKDDWIIGFENQQIYFNHKLMDTKKMNSDELITKCYQFIKYNFKQVQHTYLVSDILKGNNTDIFSMQIRNGILENRCGDIYILFESGWLEDMPKGTSHGTFFAYDTHVPLIFWGNRLHKNEIKSEVNITDIAPTLANLLKIQEPSGSIGKVIDLRCKH